MNNTMPSRTATAAELADESARTGRALAGAQLPRTLHALCEQGARLVNCGHCWARPGTPCDGADGYHLARIGRAVIRGLMTTAEFATVTAHLDVFTDGTLIRDGDR